MRVTVRGKTYETVRECADHFGISTATVYCAVSRRDPDSIGLGRGRIKNNPGGGIPKRPVTVAGRRFASIAELARFIDRRPRDVCTSLHAGEIARSRIVTAVMKRQADVENQRMRETLKSGVD
jgi:hypothetical protein